MKSIRSNTKKNFHFRTQTPSEHRHESSELSKIIFKYTAADAAAIVLVCVLELDLYTVFHLMKPF